MSLSNYFHILNPSSLHRESVRAYVQAHPDLKLAWVERTSHPTHLETILNWAVVEKQTKICVWGGDGSVNRTLQFLFDREALDQMEMALVPAGTCNDFFRKNYSTHDEGIRQHFDLGVLWTEQGEKIFLNNAGFGRASENIRSKPRHPISDIFQLTKKAIQLNWLDKGVTQTCSLEVLLSVVCNSPYFNCGLHFDASSDPKDSFLDGYFEKSQNKLFLIWKLLRGRSGKAMRNRNTMTIKSQKITVTSLSELFPQVDGEPATVGPVHSLRFESRPKMLSLALFQRPF